MIRNNSSEEMNPVVSLPPNEQPQSPLFRGDGASLDCESGLVQDILSLLKPREGIPFNCDGELIGEILRILKRHEAEFLECDTYSVQESAVVVGCDNTTIYRLLTKGYLTALPGMRHKRIFKQKVHQYTAGQITAPDTSVYPSISDSNKSGRKRRARRISETPTTTKHRKTNQI